MQIILCFIGTINQYSETFHDLTLQLPKRCHHCGCTKIYKWGKYHRFLLDENQEHFIPIQRIRCSKCLKTSSFLPDFCLSKIQYSTNFVMTLLKWILIYKKLYHTYLKTQIYFLKRRFLDQTNTFIFFLRQYSKKEFSIIPERKSIEIFNALYSLHKEKKLLSDFFSTTTKHFMAQ